MAISRMQQPRQMYGLGSLVKKAVKGVTGAVKSIVKSPIGKAAILGAGIYGLSGGAGLGSLFGKAKTFLGGLPGAEAIGNYLGTKGGKTLLMAGAGSLLGGLAAKAEQGDSEAVAATRDVGALKNYLTEGYRNLGYTEDEIPQLVEQGVSEYSQDRARVGAAYGGRIGFFKGAQADARAGKGAMSPGTSMSGGFRGGGDGGGNKDTTPKTNIFDKIKNNPIYQTVSPFVNPFSIGMSQIPVKAQQAIGIGSLLNKLGNVIFSPAGAAEFDMEAFQKAGADKGFFGGMNDELEAMQEYYDAAKSLTTPGAKFAGANNPQAVRDFITKQSEIPFGGGSYNIDMSLVPKTFLETQQDFTTQKAPISFFNLGGRAGYAFGDVVDQASGIMGLPQRINQAGVTELDLRETGGFIPPVGVKEKADDIPAMLSNNEFVFTADAVRNMGDGNVNKGAQRMYDMMKYLEKGGRV
jgi:hypothetical protein